MSDFDDCIKMALAAAFSLFQVNTKSYGRVGVYWEQIEIGDTFYLSDFSQLPLIKHDKFGFFHPTYQGYRPAGVEIFWVSPKREHLALNDYDS